MLTQLPFITLLSFFLGASIASFLYAWTLRLKSKKESILDRSKCRFCNKKLSAIELIPVFSWVFQRGKCSCKKYSLAKEYVIAELFLGAIFALIPFYFHGLSIIFIFFFAAALFFFFLTDFHYQLLHMPAMMVTLFVGLLFHALVDQDIDLSLWGIGFGFGILFLIDFLYRFFRKKQGLGNGDKYLMAAIGAWIGPIKILATLFFASWIATLWAIYLIYKKRADLMTKIPLGVFISIATPITYFLL